MAEETGGLPELVDALKWRWKLALLVAIPLFAGAAYYAESLPAYYTAKAVVAVTSAQDPNQVTLASAKYVAYLTGPATVQRLAKLIDIRAGTLQDSVDATVPTDTGNLTITATFQSPEEAARVANAFADNVLKYSLSDPSGVSLSIIVPATVPKSPSGPPRRLMEVAGLLVGLLVGFAVAVLVERSRPRVRTWREMAVLTGFPIVGRIPSSRAMRGSPGRAFGDERVGAAVRILRTNLERELGGELSGVVVVASATEGEGKTTLAAVLAAALARLDMRVLLVDADLRRATLTRNLSMEVVGGLAGLLRMGGFLAEQVQPGWTEGLWVLPTQTEPEAGDLLARHFGEVVGQARQEFDVVIVDSPALLGTDDAATLATLTDGVLLVVTAGITADALSEAVLALHGLRVQVWGVVANRVREAPGSYTYTSVG